MKKALGVFFLLIFTVPVTTFAQSLELADLPSSYTATKVLDNLPLTSYFTYDPEGNFIVAEKVGNNTKIVKISPDGQQTVLLQNISQPLLGLSFFKGKVYVITRGRIATITRGRLADVVSGLPASGDYANSGVIFEGGRMYFTVGTATNSGIVGPDNSWLLSRPSTHDLACDEMVINQVNKESDNVLTKKKDDKAYTGPFLSFNTQAKSEFTTSSAKCNGSILSANPDGSGLSVYAFGLHNPKGVSFDSKGNLYVLDSAMQDRGVRPVKDGKDALYKVSKGNWYGLPDFNAGNSIGEALVKNPPNAAPIPESTFAPGHISQFTINQFDESTGLAIYGPH
jgi:glucose/arabinose dehydrogenase